MYTIVEAIPSTFITIIYPADQYVDTFSIDCLATELNQVGVWLVTLQAELLYYPGIVTTTTFTVTVTHAC
jgi:hypothetical protein